MKALKNLTAAFVAEEDGASMIEYGLLAALIALIVAFTAAQLGNALKTRFSDVKNCVTTANGSGCPST